MSNQNLTNELPWIAEARSHIGLHEGVGAKNNPTITGWLKDLGATWSDDATPWCGILVGRCLKVGQRDYPKSFAWAKAYLNTGTRLSKPAYGCIAVKSRIGGGHVFFVVGKTRDGHIVGLGGNQGDAVTLAKYSPSIIDGYMWPSKKDGTKSTPLEYRYDLPIYEVVFKKLCHSNKIIATEGMTSCKTLTLTKRYKPYNQANP